MRRGLDMSKRVPPKRGTAAYGGLMEGVVLPEVYEVEVWDDGRRATPTRLLFDHHPALEEWAATGFQRVGRVWPILDRELLTGMAVWGIDAYVWDGQAWINRYEEGC